MPAVDPLQPLQPTPQSADWGGDLVRNLGYQMARGDFLSPSSNPFLAQTIDAAIKPSYQTLTEKTLPMLSSAAVQSGAYGGARDQLGRAQAIRDFGQTSQDTAAKLAFGNYTTERQNQMAAPGLLSQGLQIQMSPADLLSKVGDAQTQDSQSLLDEAFAQYQMQQQAPWAGLGEFSSILNGGNFTNSTATSQQNVKSGGIGGALQGALGGASLAGSLGSLGLFGSIPAGATGMAALGGPWGLAAGAGLGLLGSLFQ